MGIFASGKFDSNKWDMGLCYAGKCDPEKNIFGKFLGFWGNGLRENGPRGNENTENCTIPMKSRRIIGMNPT
jgi:hypothetical protein